MATSATEPTRRIWRIHLSTAVVLLLVASALGSANLTVHSTQYSQYYGIGWPFAFMKRQTGIFHVADPAPLPPGAMNCMPNPKPIPTLRAFFQKPSATFYSFDAGAFSLDVIVATAMLCIATKLWLSFAHRGKSRQVPSETAPRRRWQLHLSSAVLLALFAAVLLGINVMVFEAERIFHPGLLFPMCLSILVFGLVAYAIETAVREECSKP